jgi:2-polyprenyl-3-methyl-5-hydroxy-6-metoxy-1,4-benzoquinol methylase
MTKELFETLKKIDQKPKPYQFCTTAELWCDPYIAKKMLAYHLSDNEDLASRKKDFIERSVEWIFDYFKIGKLARICDFGCGPGLYTSRFAEKGALTTGIDFSESSINYAITEAKKKNLKIEYALQDYLKFETEEKFDLITMIYCDFCALNPAQRSTLLKKFQQLLKNDGSILMDVTSLASYDAKQEARVFEYCEKDGFWSPDPYYVFRNDFKYEKERLLLDKYWIIEKSRTREIYNWIQCFSPETIAAEFTQNGLEIVDYFANVAGDRYQKNNTEFAIVARKK